MGLYPYTRGGVTTTSPRILLEIDASLRINRWEEEGVLFLAGDEWAAGELHARGLPVTHIFTDAPAAIHRDAAHKMKHWMCLWALREFGEFLWVDWDVICLQRPDVPFWDWARSFETPKFIFIPNYWATVNCAVYYACATWADIMEESFVAEVSQPNDELLWSTILPTDVTTRIEFWWDNRVFNIWNKPDYSLMNANAYFCHVRNFNDVEKIKGLFLRSL